MVYTVFNSDKPRRDVQIENAKRFFEIDCLFSNTFSFCSFTLVYFLVIQICVLSNYTLYVHVS